MVNRDDVQSQLYELQKRYRGELMSVRLAKTIAHEMECARNAKHAADRIRVRAMKWVDNVFGGQTHRILEEL